MRTVAMPRTYYRKAEPEGHVRVRIAAERLNVSRQRVLQMLDDGILAGCQPQGPGTLRFVKSTSIEATIRRAKEDKA